MIIRRQRNSILGIAALAECHTLLKRDIELGNGYSGTRQGRAMLIRQAELECSAMAAFAEDAPC